MDRSDVFGLLSLWTTAKHSVVCERSVVCGQLCRLWTTLRNTLLSVDNFVDCVVHGPLGYLWTTLMSVDHSDLSQWSVTHSSFVCSVVCGDNFVVCGWQVL